MKKILFYTANGVGLGHLQRSRLIVESLKAKSKNTKIILTTLSPSPYQFKKFFDHLVKLTPLSDRLLGNPSGTFEARLANGQKFLGVLKKYKPDLIIADFHLSSPFTFYPLNFALDNFSVKTIFIWRLGDINSFRRDLEKEKGKLNYFQEILLPHNQNELEDLLPASLLRKVKSDSKFKICGPIFKKLARDKINFCRRKYKISSRDFFLLLTIGGGGRLTQSLSQGRCEEADKIIKNFLTVYPSLVKEIPNLKTIVVTGPYFRNLKKKSSSRLKIIRFEENLLELMSLAKLVISPAGYNTCNELIQTKTPAILTPLWRGGGEQFQRASYLEKKGVVKVFDGQSANQFLDLIINCKENLDKMKTNFRRFSPYRQSNNEIAKIISNLLKNNMDYFLKISSFCNNNCLYCGQLGKRVTKDKNLAEIRKELGQAKEKEFNSIKLSCNTDFRKDFLQILRLIKGYNFKIILETNGRMFYYPDFLRKVGKYIDKYEVYLSFSNPGLCYDISGIEEGYKQTIEGIKNIARFSKKPVMAKLVLMGHNLPFLSYIVDKIKELGINQLKLILPFKSSADDPIPSLPEAAPNVKMIKRYARQKGIKVISNEGLEYNPYIIQDFDFFDTKKSELKIDFKKYKNKPQFSIIIPTYNKRDSLKFVLNNFFRQNYPKSKYEIIVVDDGSSDQTLQSIKKIKPTCNFRYFYWPRKINLKGKFNQWAKFYNRAGLTRNIALKDAQGEIILFNDADILVSKDCLKRHSQYHNKYPDIIVRGFRMFLPKKFKPDFKKIEDFIFLDKISFPEKNEIDKKLHCRLHNLPREGWQRFIPANLSIRKKYLDKLAGFKQDSPFWGYEDTELGYRLSKLPLKLIWDDKIKVYHLDHPSQTGDILNTLATFWINTNILYRKYLDEEIYNVYRDVIMYRLEEIILR